MIRKKNVKTGEVVSFASADSIGVSFGMSEWVEIVSVADLLAYDLSKAIDSKVRELDAFYSSDECWNLTVQKTGYSLTKPCRWWSEIGLPIAFISDTSQLRLSLYDDAGGHLEVQATKQIMKEIIMFQVALMQSIYRARRRIKTTIEEQTVLSDVANINIIQEFASINRILALPSA